MAIHRYEIDLKSLSAEERSRVIELLNRISETELKPTNALSVCTFFAEETEINRHSLQLPLAHLRRVP